MVSTGNGDDPPLLSFPDRAVDQDVVDGGAEQSRARAAGPGGQAADARLLPRTGAAAQVPQRGMIAGGVEVPGHDQPGGRPAAQGGDVGHRAPPPRHRPRKRRVGVSTNDDGTVTALRLQPDRTETGPGRFLHLPVAAQSGGDEDGRGVRRVGVLVDPLLSQVGGHAGVGEDGEARGLRAAPLLLGQGLGQPPSVALSGLRQHEDVGPHRIR